MHSSSKKIAGSADNARAVIDQYRKAGRTIVHCHGVFDVLHPGHLAHLEEARALGDFLVVSVTADEFVNKGPGRPLLSLMHRMSMLAALELVDLVVPSHASSGTEVIGLVRPDLFVKGPDYQKADQDLTGNLDRERKKVHEIGGRLATTSGATMSSSELINASGTAHTEETEQWLDDFRRDHSALDVIQYLDSLRELSVVVIGEAIVDKYIFCEALGKTSKDPVLAFLKGATESHVGGSVAVAKHAIGLGAKTTLITRLGKDSDAQLVHNACGEVGINLISQDSSAHQTIVKTRFIDGHTSAKVFETYEMTDELPSDVDDQEFEMIVRSNISAADLVLVADYGHGLLSPRVVSALGEVPGLVAVNTQSNAGNRGMNSISRYGRVDIVSLNGSEIGLELRQRHVGIGELLPILGERTTAQWVIVTEGARGMSIWNRVDGTGHAPAFTGVVKDRVGAGDALFVASSLLLCAEAGRKIAGLIGNLAGAMAVSDLGNRGSINAVDIKRHISALLK